MKKRGRKSTRRVIKGADMVVDIDKRLIIMSGRISRATALAFQGFLFEMQNESLGEITIKIRRGNGGCAISSMMIYGLLRACLAPTKCIVEGRAYSGSLLVLQGASKRVIRKRAYLRFHWANAEFAESTLYDINEVGEFFVYLLQMNEGMYEMIRERTGLPMEDIKAFFAAEATISPAKALRLHLVDEVIE